MLKKLKCSVSTHPTSSYLKIVENNVEEPGEAVWPGAAQIIWPMLYICLLSSLWLPKLKRGRELQEQLPLQEPVALASGAKQRNSDLANFPAPNYV